MNVLLHSISHNLGPFPKLLSKHLRLLLFPRKLSSGSWTYLWVSSFCHYFSHILTHVTIITFSFITAIWLVFTIVTASIGSLSIHRACWQAVSWPSSERPSCLVTMLVCYLIETAEENLFILIMNIFFKVIKKFQLQQLAA